jgi:hypothetical protein
MFRKIAFLVSLFLVVNTSFAQKNNTIPDSTKWSSPKKATVLAFIPGLGQIYNKKYWKLPIVYGGFAALIYSVSFYQNQYNILRQAVKDKNNNIPISDPSLQPYDVANLVSLRDFYRESRDLSWIGLGGLYILQIIDASVDAHLQEFDVSENISIKWQPNFDYQAGNSFIGCNIKLKF